MLLLVVTGNIHRAKKQGFLIRHAKVIESPKFLDTTNLCYFHLTNSIYGTDITVYKGLLENGTVLGKTVKMRKLQYK